MNITKGGWKKYINKMNKDNKFMYENVGKSNIEILKIKIIAKGQKITINL